MRDSYVSPEELDCVLKNRLYQAMKPGIEAVKALAKAPAGPIVDGEGYVLLDSIAEQIPLSEPKLDVKKPEGL